MYKSLLREVVDMWLKRRFKGIPQPIAIISTLFFILGVIGAITVPSGLLKVVSVSILSLAALVLLYEFFLELPSKAYQRVLPYYNIHLTQQSEPQRFISIQPCSIYLKKFDKGMLITAVDIKIRSWLFEEITINKIVLELLLPLPSNDGRFTDRKTIFLNEIDKFKINTEESRKNIPNITLNCQDKDIIISPDNVDKTFQIEGTAWLWTDKFSKLQIRVVSNVQFIVPGEFEGL
jgi:hypothetical protein